MYFTLSSIVAYYLYLNAGTWFPSQPVDITQYAFLYPIIQ